MDLIETKNNPNNFSFYNWDLIDIDIDNYYKKNMVNNMDAVIEIVEKQVIDITNNTEGYTIENGEVYLDLGLSNCGECHSLIDVYGHCGCKLLF